MSNQQKLKRFATKLHVKTGDKVMVMSGDDKGKTGAIVQIFTAKKSGHRRRLEYDEKARPAIS